jgi:cysteine desulfuration protein SufE
MMTGLDEIVDIFELLEDWDQRYQYLIELGEHLPSMPEQEKIDDNLVKGCMSTVWIHAELSGNRVLLHGDSDTSVIKGILALIISLCEGRSIEDIKQINMDDIFFRLGLDEHLSPNRHLGVYAMFELIKQKVTALESTDCAA